MKKLLFLSNLLILSFLQSPLHAASYYLYYDPNCVDRLEYVYAETQPGGEFVMYTVFMSPTEKLVLEVGIEGQSPVQPSLPGLMINCNSQDRSILGPALLDAINNKVHQVYVVSPIGRGQYRVAQVRQAYAYKNDGVEISANTAQYRFTFFRDGRSTTGDLSANDSRGRVFYMEIAGYGPCSAYVFRQTYFTANNYLDIYVVPEFGIVEERSSSVNTSFKLKRVNGIEAENYLRKVSETGMNRIMDRTVAATTPASYDNTLTPRGNTPRVHVVEKGETQFSISRRYQLYVSDLQSWNGLDNNTVLYPGMKIFIEPSVQTTLQPKQGLTTSGPAPSWLNAPATVSVQAGETAGILAKKYGYTEERFRYFNNLSPTAVLRPGDMVKTTDCEITDQGAIQPYDSYDVILPADSVNPQTSPFYQDPYWAEFAPSPAANTTTAKSPAPAKNVSAIPRYYGPVPGTYNANQPLSEPLNDPNAYLRNNPALTAPAPYEYTAPKTAVPPDSYNVNLVPKGPETIVRRIHIVREGETLSAIAQRYGITIETLRKLNNLSPGETVITYQRLFIN